MSLPEPFLPPLRPACPQTWVAADPLLSPCFAVHLAERHRVGTLSEAAFPEGQLWLSGCS